MEWSATSILDLSFERASDLLGPREERGKIISDLVRAWHPDVCQDPLASSVFLKILDLKEFVETQDNNSNIEGIEITYEGSRKSFKAQEIGEWTGGRRWVSKSHWAWSFEKSPDLAERFVEMLEQIYFADSKMKLQFENIFPLESKLANLKHGTPIVLMPRHKSALLCDWIKVHGPLPPVHAAWIGSGLMNIAAWANWAGWSLPSISLETVSIEPISHTVYLPGGWEASCSKNEIPDFLPERVLNLFPDLASYDQILPENLTGQMIRQTLKECLGSSSGIHLDQVGVPFNMRKWLFSSAPKNAAMDYSIWCKNLEKDFGPRKFVKCLETVKSVYPFLNENVT
jgi:hypothetical protein